MVKFLSVTLLVFVPLVIGLFLAFLMDILSGIYKK